MQRVVIVSGVILVIIVSVLGIIFSDYREKSFQETLNIEQETISKITMEIGGTTKSTTNKAKINKLLEHLDQMKYQRMRGDYTGYMPTQAAIIYFHTDDYVDFIVPYNDEAMISYKVYKVKDDEITKHFLITYYNSLDYQ